MDDREGAIRLHNEALKGNAIELDITDHCNVGCYNCSRGADIVSSNYKRGELSLDDVKRFISESQELNHHWRLIRIIGGEPTLHNDLCFITKVLYEYCIKENTRLRLHSNGATSESCQIIHELRKMYPKLEIEYAKKQLGNKQTKKFHLRPYVSPMDKNKLNAIQKGTCYCTHSCGMGLASTGYGICCCVHNMVKLYKTTSGLNSLADLFNQEKAIEHILRFCPHCGITLGDIKSDISRYWIDYFKREHPVHWEALKER